MYTKFLAEYSLSGSFHDFDEKYAAKAKEFLEDFPDLRDLFDRLGGSIFDQGVYRIHTYSSSLYWTKIVSSYFDEYKNKAYCFGYDWFGRHFAIDLNNHKTGKDLIYLFDPATGEVFQLNQILNLFHEEDLVDYKNDTLAYKRFKQWQRKSKQPLQASQCVGFKVPLFLGGHDEVENFEITDMDVYWEFSYQALNKIKNLPEGTLINKISLGDDLQG